MDQFEQVTASANKEADRANKEQRRADGLEDKNRALEERLAALESYLSTQLGDASPEILGTFTGI